MRSHSTNRRAIAALTAGVAAAVIAMPVVAGGPQVVLQSGTNGCNGVLPSSGGNTNMRVIGGSMTPGGTAIFEISYPVTASSVGKQFTILDCAFINDVATLKYIVLVGAEQSVIRAADDPRRTRGRPGWRALLQLREDHRQPHGSAGKSAQGWPRLLRDPRPGNDCSAPRGLRYLTGTPSSPSSPSSPSDPSVPILLPNTAMAAPSRAP